MKNKFFINLLVCALIMGMGSIPINAVENDKGVRYICNRNVENPIIYLVSETVAGDIDKFEFADKYNEKLSADTNVKTGDTAIGEDSIKYTVALLGDVNSDGYVTAGDARTALRMSAELDSYSDIMFAAADVDCSDSLTANDARNVLRTAAQISSLNTFIDKYNQKNNAAEAPDYSVLYAIVEAFEYTDDIFNEYSEITAIKSVNFGGTTDGRNIVMLVLIEPSQQNYEQIMKIVESDSRLHAIEF